MLCVQQELGRPHKEVFSTITSEPIAAASLGQVYRATLASCGADVAVKVQRPGVLELVALDLVIGRKGIELAGALFPDIRSEQIIPVLDEWAFKLYREMDYRRERDVMQQFRSDLSDLSGIVVPESYAEATTRRVLCTQWIQGEKLSESNANDVRQLCTTLLNAYLIQLLDTGLLHADPHPGNLIRTPDGKICILDYGVLLYDYCDLQTCPLCSEV
jgi:aarF domain-containing kinase